MGGPKEPDQHTLSTSGPKKWQYQTNCLNSPRTFSVKCMDQIIEGVMAFAEDDNSGEDIKGEKNKIICQLEEELAKVRESSTTPAPLGLILTGLQEIISPITSKSCFKDLDS
jgi:hypothetical protein